jgi:hypothetical protein
LRDAVIVAALCRFVRNQTEHFVAVALVHEQLRIAAVFR